MSKKARPTQLSRRLNLRSLLVLVLVLIAMVGCAAGLWWLQAYKGSHALLVEARARLEKKHKRVVALHDRVAARPRIAAYLASERRVPFNESDIFRRYRELDRA